MRTTIPDYDAVAMQHEGAQQIYDETTHLTSEEEQAYWDDQTEVLLAEQRNLQQAAESTVRDEELAKQS